MALKKREKTLALGAGVLGVGYLAVYLLAGTSNPFAQLNADRANLAKEVEEKKEQVQKGAEAETKLDDWRKRALPSDPRAGAWLYENWLLEVATRTGMRNVSVKPSAKRTYKNIYHSFAFSVQGRTSLENLAKLLYEYFSAGHLHQIRRLSINPAEGSREFDVTLLTEALSLPDADRTNELTSEKSDRLSGDLDTYLAAIVDRNVFAPYEPPRPVQEAPREPAPPPAFDHSKHTYVTGIVSVNGVPEVWIQVRTNGKSYRLHEGDRFEVGATEASVVTIGSREVIIDFGDERLLAFRGDNLGDAEVLENRKQVALDQSDRPES
jgi:hypothetical protein